MIFGIQTIPHFLKNQKLNVWLLSVCIVLIIIFYKLYASPPRQWEDYSCDNSAPSGPVVTSGITPDFVPPLRQEFLETANRPVFSPSRRPPPPVAPVEAPPPPPPPLNLSLVGVIVGPETRLAIIKVLGSTNTTKVSLGQAINGWTVVQVGADRIVLRAGTAEQEVRTLPPSQTMNTGGTAAGMFPSPSQGFLNNPNRR